MTSTEPSHSLGLPSELEALERSLSEVIDAIAWPTGVLVWRRDGRLAHANQRACELVRRPLPPGLPCADWIRELGLLRADTDEPLSAEEILPAAAFEGGGTQLPASDLAFGEGERRTIQGFTAPVRGPGGAIDHAISAIFDVTERRRADKLRAGEAELLEMMATGAPLLSTLQALAKTFERQADGMLASILLVENGVCVRHAAAPSLPERWATFVDGEPIGPDRGSCGTAAHLKAPVVVDDIAVDPRWALYRDAALSFGLRACWSVPILGAEGDVLGTFAFYYTRPRKPTERLLNLAAHASRLATIAIQQDRQRLALLESEARLAQLREREQLHSLLQLAPSVVSISQAGKVVYVNRKAADTFGLSVGNDAFAHLLPAQRERITEELQREGAVFDRELEARARDGSVLDMLATFQAIRYGGEPALFAHMIDVGGLKRAERRLQQLSERLASAKDAAEEASRAKSRFLASMSHEIRTPMNAVLGFGQLIRRDAELSPENKDRLEKLLSSGDHLLGLIDKVLEMSKLEAGRTTSNVAPFDLHEAIAHVDAIVRSKIEGAGLVLNVEGRQALPRQVQSDAGKLRQILINLLDNAAKFTPSGSVTLRASAEEEGDGTRLTFDVIDTGIGIAEADCERIFEPFEQGRDASTHGGAGLGLSISRNFARLLGGDVTVRSEPNRGSTFRVELKAKRVRRGVLLSSSDLESTPSSRRLPGPVLSASERIALRALGAPALLGLRRAVTLGDVDDAEEILNRVSDAHPETVSLLRHTLQEFALETLLAWLTDALSERAD